MMNKLLIKWVAVLGFFALAGSANAAVYGPQQQLPAQTIEAFKADPSQLLRQFTSGGQLTARVRDLGASDPSTLPMLIELLKTSDQSTQMPAIAAGLAQLARMAARSDQAFGNEIATAVAMANNAEALRAYQAAVGDVAIAATGGAGAGSGGGGPTSSIGGAAGGSGGSATMFGALNYPTPVTSGASVGFSSAVTGASGSVSDQ